MTVTKLHSYLAFLTATVGTLLLTSQFPQHADVLVRIAPVAILAWQLHAVQVQTLELAEVAQDAIRRGNSISKMLHNVNLRLREVTDSLDSLEDETRNLSISINAFANPPPQVNVNNAPVPLPAPIPNPPVVPVAPAAVPAAPVPLPPAAIPAVPVLLPPATPILTGPIAGFRPLPIVIGQLPPPAPINDATGLALQPISMRMNVNSGYISIRGLSTTDVDTLFPLIGFDFAAHGMGGTYRHPRFPAFVVYHKQDGSRTVRSKRPGEQILQNRLQLLGKRPVYTPV